MPTPPNQPIQNENGPGPRPELRRLEADLKRIPGVTSARIVGSGPSEIHIVSTGARPAKQLVRDIQSLAAAGHNVTIDHRIVSVVELAAGAESEGSNATDRPPRPIIEWLIAANQRSRGRVDVGLRWNGSETAGGAQVGGDSRDAKARAAVQAVIEALEPRLSEKEAVIEVETLLIQTIGSAETVTLKVNYKDQTTRGVSLIGTAIIQDDVMSAAARALLDAVNRRIT